jgi:hypothetical protein
MLRLISEMDTVVHCKPSALARIFHAERLFYGKS